MKQAIAGVSPAEVKEVTVMTVWPSLAASALGRLLGQAYSVQWPGIYFFKIGNLLALLSIPIALVLYFLRVSPFFGVRYKLTNRRIIIQRGLAAVDHRWVDLERFDRIEVQVRPGQGWYKAGDLVFFLGNVETFRLDGVSRPQVFRQICLKAHMSYVGTKKAVQRQLAHA